MSLKRKFKNYQIGWAVAQWYSTCLGCKALGSIIRNTRKKLSCGPEIPLLGMCSQEVWNQGLKEVFLHLCIINIIHRSIIHDCPKGNQAKCTSTDEWTQCTKHKKNNAIKKHSKYSKREAAANPADGSAKKQFYVPEVHTKILIKGIVE